MMVEQLQADGSTVKVQTERDVEPCIRPGLSLVYIPDLGQRNADGSYKTPGDITGSIQLPKGSLSWWLGGDPHTSNGDEVDESASGTDDR
jgi:hypothetical protein